MLSYIYGHQLSYYVYYDVKMQTKHLRVNVIFARSFLHGLTRVGRA